MATEANSQAQNGSCLPDQSDPKQSTVLSDYERIRAINIEKNNTRLRALGLISAEEERQSNALAWGREDEHSNKKRKLSSGRPREGSRKSRRLSKLPPDLFDIAVTVEHEEDTKGRIQMEREGLVKECREARQRAALAVAKLGVENAGKENPTATYDHCLMRVRSMTEKGLINRIRSIERAAGKHCVVKMAIFKSCLQDENMWELAELASEALERLKGFQSPP